MAWHDRDGQHHLATYSNKAAWQRDMAQAARYGWTTRATNPQPDSNGKFQVNYTRTPSAEAKARLDRMNAQLTQTRARLAIAETNLNKAARALRVAVEEARGHESKHPVQLESGAYQAAKNLVTSWQALEYAQQATATALGAVSSAYENAKALRVTITEPVTDCQAEIQTLNESTKADEPRIRYAYHFAEAQRQAVSAVRDWQKAIGHHWDRKHLVASTEERIASLRPQSGAKQGLLERAKGIPLHFYESRLPHHKETLKQHYQSVTETETALVKALNARDAAYARLTFPTV